MEPQDKSWQFFESVFPLDLVKPIVNTPILFAASTAFRTEILSPEVEIPIRTSFSSHRASTCLSKFCHSQYHWH